MVVSCEKKTGAGTSRVIPIFDEAGDLSQKRDTRLCGVVFMWEEESNGVGVEVFLSGGSYNRNVRSYVPQRRLFSEEYSNKTHV